MSEEQKPIESLELDDEKINAQVKINNLEITTRVQYIEIKNLFKNINTWDLAWMMCKLTFAFLLSMPVFLAVIVIWVFILFVIFPTSILALLDGITTWLGFVTDFLKGLK